MEKHSLRSVLLPYPKKVWRAGPRQSFFGHDTNYKIVQCCVHRSYSVVGVRPARQSFFWHDNDKDVKARFPMTRLTALALEVFCSDSIPTVKNLSRIWIMLESPLKCLLCSPNRPIHQNLRYDLSGMRGKLRLSKVRFAF